MSDNKNKSCSIINIENLSYSFNSRMILKNLNLQIKQGESYTLVGENGAGKTTLINLLSGLNKPISGSIEISGINSTDFHKGYPHKVSIVPENGGLYPWMTVAQNCSFVSKLSPGWDSGETDKLIKRLGLRYDSKVKNLSRGEKGKLRLLLALSSHPDLLIMDEPTLGLDPKVKRSFMEEIVNLLLTEGKTVFFTTHEMYEAERLAQRVGFLMNGKIVLDGSIEAVKATHRIVTVKGSSFNPTVIKASSSFIIRSHRNMGESTILEISDWTENTEEELKSSGLSITDISAASLEDIFCMYDNRDAETNEEV